VRRFFFSQLFGTGIPIAFAVGSWYAMVLVLGWDQWIALPTCIAVAYFLRHDALGHLQRFLSARPQKPRDERRRFVTKLILLYMFIPITALLGDFVSMKTQLFHPTFSAVGALIMTLFVTGKHLNSLIVDTDEEHVRGRVLITFAEAARRAAEYLVGTTSGLFWGGLYLPFCIARNHFLIQGINGSGKTITIRLLMQSVFRLMTSGSDCRAIVYDDKCELYPVLRGMLPEDKVVTLNPYDARCHAWNIAADVTGQDSAWEIAALLVPDQDGDHPYFRDAVRTIVSLVMESFHQNTPGSWTLRDVVVAMDDFEMAKSIVSRVEGGRQRFENVLSKVAAVDTTQNVVSTIAIRMRPFRSAAQAWYLATQEGRKARLSEWINGEFVVHLGKVEAFKSGSDIINRILLTRAQQLALDPEDSETRQTWFFLDEVRGVGKLPGLYDLLNKGRSKGACVVLGFQDIEGMREVYGTKMAEEICGECHQTALLKAKSPPSAEWASVVIGNEEYIGEDTTRGPSGDSTSERQQSRPLVMPEEIKQIPVTGIVNPSTGHRNGLCGYYVTELLNEPYKHTMPSEELTARLAPVADVPKRIRRDESELYLKLWGDADLQRLKLTGPPESEQQDLDLIDLF